MAENHEGDAGTERPSPGEHAAGDPPQAEAPRAEQMAYGSRGGRFRRWSRSAPAQFAAVGLLAGLVGGLVGGGIVAAVGGGDDRPRLVEVERGFPPGWGPREFRPRREPFFRMSPGRPEEPRPTPTS